MQDPMKKGHPHMADTCRGAFRRTLVNENLQLREITLFAEN